MRMRKKKNGEARLNCCAEFILEPTGEPMADPAAEIGMPGAPVLLEIGAGKGGFAVKMAELGKITTYSFYGYIVYTTCPQYCSCTVGTVVSSAVSYSRIFLKG